MGKVVVFGSFVVDLMARSTHLPVSGETVKGSMFKMGPGGKGFNQCVAAHKAGADVVMVTKLGKDSFANVATDAMDELGMPKDSLFFTEETETGIALILVDENTSQNEIIIVPGACNTITDAEVDSIEEQIKESEYVLLQLEVNQDANERVVDMANRYGCKVIVNTAPYSKISDEFLSKVYMVTPNEVEAEELTGVHVEDLESAHKAAEYFYKKGVEKVIITLGSRGVFVSSDGKEEIVPFGSTGYCFQTWGRCREQYPWLFPNGRCRTPRPCGTSWRSSPCSTLSAARSKHWRHRCRNQTSADWGEDLQRPP